MPDVLVFGAGGATGRALVQRALRAGYDVTAAVRDPRRYSAPSGVGVVVADARDPESVRAAVDGHRAVLSAIGPAGRRAEGLYSAWAAALVDAMPTGRVVALTSSGVRPDDPHHPVWYRLVARTLMRELYGDMRRMEEVLGRSALDWTVVRPARITDDPPTGNVRIGDGENPRSGRKVSRGDLADFMVGALSTDRWSRARPTLAE